jgi:hypothetical protein
MTEGLVKAHMHSGFAETSTGAQTLVPKAGPSTGP